MGNYFCFFHNVCLFYLAQYGGFSKTAFIKVNVKLNFGCDDDNISEIFTTVVILIYYIVK